MAGTYLRNATIARPALEEAAVDELETRLRGELIRPGDEDYDNARKVDNATIDWRPQLITRCADVADFIAAVNFAREQKPTVAVRGGSHNVTGSATYQGGLAIDLPPMKGSGRTR